MPITKSAKKALRQSKTRGARNKTVKRAMKEAEKSLRKAIEANDQAQVRALLPVAYKKIDKAAKKGVIYENTASRKKSRLTKRASKVLTS